MKLVKFLESFKKQPVKHIFDEIVQKIEKEYGKLGKLEFEGLGGALSVSLDGVTIGHINRKNISSYKKIIDTKLKEIAKPKSKKVADETNVVY